MLLVRVERLSDGKKVWVDSERVNPELHKVTEAAKPEKPATRKRNAKAE
jgi:hypothetical protein